MVNLIEFPDFFSSKLVKQPSKPQNPQGFSPICCNSSVSLVSCPSVAALSLHFQYALIFMDQNATEKYRRDNQIPDSDGFAMIMPRDKRGRSETMSTNLSDKHDTNRPKYAGIPEAVLE